MAHHIYSTLLLLSTALLIAAQRIVIRKALASIVDGRLGVSALRREWQEVY
jgi:hypothetical protein